MDGHLTCGHWRCNESEARGRRSVAAERYIEPQYTYRCSNCSAECRYDHEGNGCHACSRGFMRRVRKD